METKLLNLMRNRRSIRKYRTHVSLETISATLEAGRWAPSGANCQPWIYIIVTDANLKENIGREAEDVESIFTRKPLTT